MMKLPAAFAGFEDICDLGHGDGVDMRPTLLRVLTDLYLQRPTHTTEDERYYTELALRLIEATDVPERAALAARLAPFPSAPRAVIERLARDIIDVARPILERSPCLSAADLAAIAQDRGGAHAEIIAMRPPAPRSTASATSPAEAARAEACELSELFYAADAAERRLILVNLDYASLAPARPLANIQRADVWRLESAALQHNTETVLREIERMLGVSRAQARRIVEDELGEPIVVAAKAIDLRGRRTAAHAAVHEPSRRPIGQPRLPARRALQRDQRGRGAPDGRDLARRRRGRESPGAARDGRLENGGGKCAAGLVRGLAPARAAARRAFAPPQRLTRSLS